MSLRTLPELLIATRNAGKVREIISLCADMPLRLRSLADFPETIEAEETGATFAENASLKARFYAAQTGLWALADDSGLEVDALGGAPGVRSARYAGPNATDAERVTLLLRELGHAGAEAGRRARFICAIAIVDPATGTAHIFSGKCEGQIAHAPRGTKGFGYDPVFIPEGYQQTFGELPAHIKQRISHRARALAAAHVFLYQKLGGTA